MCKKLIVLACSIFLLYTANAQVTLNSFLRYGYSIENQFDNRMQNGINWTNMAGRLMIEHPILGQNANHVSGYLSAGLESSESSVSINSNVGETVALGFDNINGTSLKGRYHFNKNNNTLNVSAGGHFNPPNLRIAGQKISNNSNGGEFQTHHSLTHKKNTFSTHVMGKIDNRDYQVESNNGMLKKNQSAIGYSHAYTYQSSTNVQFGLNTTGRWYDGSIESDSFSFSPNQVNFEVGGHFQFARPKLFSKTALTYSYISNEEAFSFSSQNRLNFTSTLTPQLGNKSSLSMRNTVVNSGLGLINFKTRFHYLPQLHYAYNHNRFSIHSMLGRNMYTQLSSLSIYPFMDYHDIGLINIFTNKALLVTGFNIRNHFHVQTGIQYSQFENFGIDDQALNEVAKAHVRMHYSRSKYRVKLSYHRRFAKQGILATTIPNHTVSFQASIYQLPLRIPYAVSHKKIWLEFQGITGFRSDYEIFNNAGTYNSTNNQWFTDAYIKINRKKRDYYYNQDMPFVFYFSAKNLFNSPMLTPSLAQENLILLTEGIRLSRSLEVKVTYAFTKK